MLLDGRDLVAVGGSGRGWYVQRWCPITAPLLGDTRSPTYDTEMDQQIKVYIESGTGPNALGVRVPVVFWLVMCGCFSPQMVLAALTSENAGSIELGDLRRLFGDRWVLESLIEHWSKKDLVLKAGNGTVRQREFPLLPIRIGEPHSKKHQLVHANGRVVHLVGPNGGTKHFTMDEFTSAATAWSQRSGHLRAAELEPLTNESVLDALLSRPQILKAGTALADESLELRWRDLVRSALKTLVTMNAGPVTAQLVFDGIAKGLSYFRER